MEKKYSKTVVFPPHLTCAYVTSCRLSERSMWAHARNQTTVGSQAFPCQQDGSIGLQICVRIILSGRYQVSRPPEGRGGKSTRPGAEQFQRCVVQGRLHRAGRRAVRRVCGGKISVMWSYGLCTKVTPWTSRFLFLFDWCVSEVQWPQWQTCKRSAKLHRKAEWQAPGLQTNQHLSRGCDITAGYLLQSPTNFFEGPNRSTAGQQYFALSCGVWCMCVCVIDDRW